MPLKQDGDRHGFQARTGRREKLAPSRRSQPVAKADHRRKVHRRHPSPQPTAASRLTPDRHQHSAIALRFGGIEGTDTKPAELAAKRREDMTEALSLRRQSLKSLQPVDEEATNAAAPHRLHQPIAGFVEQTFGRWLPDNLNMTLLDQALHWQLQRLGLVQ